MLANLQVELAATELPQRLSVAAYRIIQEALTNVIRHARATRVDIDVRVNTDRQSLDMRIVDDGRGLPDVGSDKSPVTGLGLVGMKERVLANRGTLHMGRADLGGLEINVSFPLC